MAITAEQRTNILRHVANLEASVANLDRALETVRRQRALAVTMLDLMKKKLKEGLVQ